jgi:hypothetical protein
MRTIALLPGQKNRVVFRDVESFADEYGLDRRTMTLIISDVASVLGITVSFRMEESL